MDTSQRYYAKWKKPDQRVLPEWFHLNEILEKTKQLWEKKQNTDKVGPKAKEDSRNIHKYSNNKSRF